jgi:hypothetical protein
MKRARRAAPLEDRLRKWVQRRIERHGEQKRFGDAVRRPESWVSTYLDGRVHPDLDTTIQIARAFNLRLEEVTGLHPLPEPDQHTLALLETWALIPEEERELALQILAPFARQRVTTPGHTPSGEVAMLATVGRRPRKRRGG